MPLLASEPISFPDNLFEGLTAASRQWSVFQTRPRAEKTFARVLRKSQTPYFLPQYTKNWRNKGRGFQSSLPLFPGYIFLCGGEARRAAFATNLVVREVAVSDQPTLDRELGAISRLLGGDGSLCPEEGIARGCRVLVVEGIYAGIEGRATHDVGNDEIRLSVEISLLGRGVSVLVERWMIKVLD